MFSQEEEGEAEQTIENIIKKNKKYRVNRRAIETR